MYAAYTECALSIFGRDIACRMRRRPANSRLLLKVSCGWTGQRVMQRDVGLCVARQGSRSEQELKGHSFAFVLTCLRTPITHQSLYIVRRLHMPSG